jgi:hypothetical protein
MAQSHLRKVADFFIPHAYCADTRHPAIPPANRRAFVVYLANLQPVRGSSFLRFGELNDDLEIVIPPFGKRL